MKTNSFIQKTMAGICTLPFIYLAYIWQSLPTKVPIHWDINGEINNWANKSFLVFIPCCLPIIFFVLLKILPKIDPKNKLVSMGKKLERLSNGLVIFFTALSMYILVCSKIGNLYKPQFLITLVGILCIFLGNYFPTVKPNYFIGIKTPWALHNDTNWIKTHALGGKLFFITGIFIVLASFIFSYSALNNIILYSSIGLVITCFGYSYYLFSNKMEV